MSQHDVIVVGGGFTGLSAATALAEAGLDVVLLEARERVGGRVESHVLPDGMRVDTGGQFLCEDMPEVMALAKAHGKTLVRAYVDGDVVFQPPMPLEQGHAIYDEVDALRERARNTDLDDPSVTRLTVTEWTNRQDASDEAKHGFLRLIDGLWCRSPDDVSFVYLASSDRRITNTQSELELFLAETMHSLAEDLAAKLGHRVVLNAPVTKVRYSGDGVEVDVGGGHFTARQAIIALPPVMARRLDFQPPLPNQLSRALAAWGSGAVIKVLARYARPFWRDRQLSGTVIWSEPEGLYACDVSRNRDDGALVIFIGGPLALDWHGKEDADIRNFILKKLVSALGEDAGKPLDVSFRDWTDDAWSGGAYSDSIIDVETTDAETTILQGLPSIRFAASELSPSFPGYIEGAIVAGRQAAEDVLHIWRGSRTAASVSK
ncbi:flavin monoamine oxidase family protein [Rhizobium sp. KVB221]|uniref:Flavin monoamine oxidase family protein n=1 Tax=Rhizobium setariae TaxID=2801340 RepID=A0A937CKT9_9HYPH|nr:flavin monoamine oxidase family protein [Rhizobium setariae]MBL0370836.1 flavin monoamine oxidase family protein [Rhizobium setariae]